MTDPDEPNALTDVAFWDDVWADVELPALVDERARWQLGLAQVLRRVLPVDANRDVFEVGCAPGRWLVWFNKNLGYRAYGCDLSARAAATARMNLQINGVEGEVYAADLLNDADLPQRQFDVVVSIGVIEHFAEPDEIVRRHVELLKPGGTLVLQVPNMAGAINRALLKAARMQALLDVHNLSTMDPEVFLALADKHQLETLALEYAGGFDPGLMVYNHSYTSRWKRPPIFFALWIAEAVTRRFPHLFLTWNHPSFSSMLIGVFRRRP